MKESSLTISYHDLLNTENTVSQNAFGGIYTSFRPYDNYTQLADSLGATLLRWPGGTLSEVREDRYGLEFHDLQHPDIPRPGLTELIADTNAADQALSVIIPTKRYQNDIGRARDDVAGFLERLAQGEYGSITNELILEIGNEFYAHFDDVRDYARVANAIMEEIAAAKATHEEFFRDNTVTVAMQMARTDEEDASLRSLISDDGKAVIDYLRTHRLSVSFNSADHRLEDDQNRLSLWKAEVMEAGGDEPGFYMSAWNSASWTRNEALDAFTREHRRHTGERPEISNNEFNQRTHQQFEEFWESGQLVLDNGQVIQTRFGLANRDYGAAKEAHILQIFSSYAYMGMDAAAIYGIDILHPSAFGVVNDSGATLLAGGGAFSLMSAFLPGLDVTGMHQDNWRPSEASIELNQWGFNSEDYAVVFVSANKFSGISDQLDVAIDLEFLPIRAWGLSIAHDIPIDWREQYDVPLSTVVDQTEEAKLYSAPSINALEYSVDGGALTFSFTQDYQVAAFVFAHTEAGAAYIDERTPVVGKALNSAFEHQDIVYIQSNSVHHGKETEDIIIVKGSNNRVGGGAGNDVIIVTGTDGNTVWGGEGDDVIIAVRGDNTLNGGAGNDRIAGGTGNDVIFGGEGDDVISVVSGNNRITGGTGSNVIFGGTGNDRIYSADAQLSDPEAIGNSFVFGMAGRNVITGGSGSDVIIGGTGSDEIRSFGDRNLIHGNGGNNSVYLNGNRDQFYSGSGRDHVFLEGNGTRLFIDASTKVARIENFDLGMGHRLFLDRDHPGTESTGARRFFLDHSEVNEWGNVEISIPAAGQRIILPGFGDRMALADSVAFWNNARTVDDIVNEYSALLDISSLFAVSEAPEVPLLTLSQVASEASHAPAPAAVAPETGPVAGPPEHAAPSSVTVHVNGPALNDLTLTSHCGAVSVIGEKVSARAFTFDLANALSDAHDALFSFTTTTTARPEATDALEALRLAVGLAPSFGSVSEFVRISADANADGGITVNDALMILKMAAGLEESAQVQLFRFDQEHSTAHRLGGDHWLSTSDLLEAQQLDLYGVGIGSLSTAPFPDAAYLAS